ncbi:MAG TPA: hypothetical protein VKW09_10885 [bacterium]|nr:hypothetical protein [bacterium]
MRRSRESVARVRAWVLALVCTLSWGALAVPAKAVPSDLCSLLSPGQIGKALGQPFLTPRTLPAPRAYHNTAAGTECDYLSQQPTGMGVPLKVVFIMYVESSPAAAKDAFARTRPFAASFGPITPVAGLGDDAYRDANYALHVLKGTAHYSINFIPMGTYTSKEDQQEKTLAAWVAGQL